MKKFLFLAIISFVISGCYSVKVVKPGNIIKENKTIEVPATGFSIMDIKAALLETGWKLKVANTNVNRTRIDPTNPKIDPKNDYDAGYRLIISESVRAEMWVIGLSASVVDKKSNEEVLNMYFDLKGMGGCQPDEVAKDIANALLSIEK